MFKYDDIERIADDYAAKGTRQYQPGDLEPRIALVEKRLENVSVNHERTLSWVKDLSADMKELNVKVGGLTEELYKLRETFARQMGMWTGGAIVVSMLISKLL